MTIENDSKPAAAPAAATPAAAAPVVDTDAIVKKATDAAIAASTEAANKAATKIAAEKITQIGKAMAGEEAAIDPGQKFLEGFLKDPLRTVRAIGDLTKKEIREEEAERDKFTRTTQKVVGGYVNDYPELNSPRRLALVERLADQYTSSGDSYEAALDKACKEAVEEFGLEKISEANSQGAYSHGLPGGGGVRSGAPKFSNEKSSSDFLAAMKSRAASFRKRQG